LIIFGNGSKWYGSPEDPIEKLYEALARHALDPRTGGGADGEFFFKPVYLNPSAQPPPGTWRAQGNFYTRSHGFCIEGTAQEMEPLQRAIEANTATPQYARALAEILGGPGYARQSEFGHAPTLHQPTAEAT
jgi:hypothetical protein